MTPQVGLDTIVVKERVIDVDEKNDLTRILTGMLHIHIKNLSARAHRPYHPGGPRARAPRYPGRARCRRPPESPTLQPRVDARRPSLRVARVSSSRVSGCRCP